jgi:UDP-glucose 4-epimerase
MLQGRQPIIYGDGNQMRCFSFVQDCIYCLKEMGFRDNVAGDVINIGPDEEFVSINQLAGTIAGLLSFDLAPIYLPDRPQEVKYATCSADKARKLLGYETRTSLTDGIADMINFIRKRGPRKFRYHLDLEIVNHLTPRTWRERLF